MRQLERAQVASGYDWPEDVKMDVLQDCLEGEALDYWQIKRDSWSGLKLERAMEVLKINYKCTLSDRQAMAHFDKERTAYRGYTEHLNYLLQVNAAGGRHFDRKVLKSMVHRSGTDLIHEILSKYYWNRTNYVNDATELAEFADELWSERNLDKSTARPNRGGSVVNAVVSKRPEMRDCYNCGRKGHLSKIVQPHKSKVSISEQDRNEGDKEHFALNVNEQCRDQELTHDAWPQTIDWILDSGCGRHLTGCAALLGEDAEQAGTPLVLPDSTKTKSLRKGSVEMSTQVGGKTRHLTV